MPVELQKINRNQEHLIPMLGFFEGTPQNWDWFRCFRINIRAQGFMYLKKTARNAALPVDCLWHLVAFCCSQTFGPMKLIKTIQRMMWMVWCVLCRVEHLQIFVLKEGIPGTFEATKISRACSYLLYCESFVHVSCQNFKTVYWIYVYYIILTHGAICLLMADCSFNPKCSIPTHSFCRTTRQAVRKAIAMSAIIERTAGELRGSITHLHKDRFGGEFLRIQCESFF